MLRKMLPSKSFRASSTIFLLSFTGCDWQFPAGSLTPLGSPGSRGAIGLFYSQVPIIPLPCHTLSCFLTESQTLCPASLVLRIQPIAPVSSWFSIDWWAGLLLNILFSLLHLCTGKLTRSVLCGLQLFKLGLFKAHTKSCFCRSFFVLYVWSLTTINCILLLLGYKQIIYLVNRNNTTKQQWTHLSVSLSTT